MEKHTPGPKSMTKSDLIAAISEKLPMTKSDIETMVNAFLETVTEALTAGTEVRLHSFGTFRVRNAPERMGKNPKTGEPIKVMASSIPTFKPSQGLKDIMNGRSGSRSGASKA